MKFIGKLLSAALLVSAILVVPVQAAQINGEITFGGAFVPVGGTSLADATAIDFLEWTGTAYVNGTSGGTLAVGGVAGDFATYITAGPFTLGTINDFSFVDPFTPVTPLWEVGGFSFDLTDIDIVDQTATSLYLRGVGEVNHADFATTSGAWSLRVSSYGATFGFSSSAVAPIPESMTLILLSIGLFGLGFTIRRKKPSN